MVLLLRSLTACTSTSNHMITDSIKNGSQPSTDLLFAMLHVLCGMAALASVPLLDSLNHTDAVRRALVLFCAAYMGLALRPEVSGCVWPSHMSFVSWSSLSYLIPWPQESAASLCPPLKHFGVGAVPFKHVLIHACSARVWGSISRNGSGT